MRWLEPLLQEVAPKQATRSPEKPCISPKLPGRSAQGLPHLLAEGPEERGSLLSVSLHSSGPSPGGSGSGSGGKSLIGDMYMDESGTIRQDAPGGKRVLPGSCDQDIKGSRRE